MTLRELKARTESTARFDKAPSMAWLTANSYPIESYQGDDFSITVYQNGFALAQAGRRKAVIRVDRCNGYRYEFDNSFLEDETDATPHDFEEEYFLGQPWPLRLMIAAEDQLESNQDTREQKWNSKPLDIPDDKNWMCGGVDSFEDSLIARLDFEKALECLTEKQREAVILYYRYGYNFREIGEMLNMSCTAAQKRVGGAMKKLIEHLK